MSKNIGVIDADLLDNGTRHPNLALLKISGYNKSLGNNVELLKSYDDISNYDEVYVSKVFTYTEVPEGLKEHKNIRIGGTGFFTNGGKELPDYIEHHKPDYKLYDEYVKTQIKNGIKEKKFKDYLDYSIGFTTRGCFRKCDFCVNKKYDKVFRHAKVSEFIEESRPKIYLWDDNILGYKGWKGVFRELEETKKAFQFRQGLDIRLMTEAKAELIANSKYSGDYIFAFDHIEQKALIEKKLKIWKKYAKKTTKLYVLTAYDSIDEIDIANTFERIKSLMIHACNPYIMRYENYVNSKHKGMYIQLARWCNQPQLYKKMSFRQFCLANQELHKTQGTYCSSMRAMIAFETEFPLIAKKYFDMRYEELKKY